MKIVNIMVGGPASELPDLKPYTNEKSTWLGVDGGAKRLLDLNIPFEIALGDFDSLTKAELADLKTKVADVRVFPAEKDQTDTEIGLEAAIAMEPNLIRIFGATGGRMDHLLANLMMLAQPKFFDAIPLVEMIDRYNYMKMYAPGEYTLVKQADKKYVAFTTMSNVSGLTLKGFKYPLENADFPFGRALSSNEFNQSKAAFSFQTGLILMTQSKDE
ncbi:MULTISPECIES: thiamine diphosphokinase [Listeria]|uniref:thiamine diphosphokinase n=1 Tax=Listeria TaxID=1637 RepID=UPI000B596875|nr:MULTISPECIES: thiamine diphosphokinase [Listeria]